MGSCAEELYRQGFEGISGSVLQCHTCSADAEISQEWPAGLRQLCGLGHGLLYALWTSCRIGWQISQEPGGAISFDSLWPRTSARFGARESGLAALAPVQTRCGARRTVSTLMRCVLETAGGSAR